MVCSPHAPLPMLSPLNKAMLARRALAFMYTSSGLIARKIHAKTPYLDNPVPPLL
jgi:hypothetical protein